MMKIRASRTVRGGRSSVVVALVTMAFALSAGLAAGAGTRSSDTFKGDDWIGLKLREASVVRGIGVLPMFAGLLGLLLLVGSLALTWAREGR